MNYDLVLAGVGGQGVLSIAWIIDHAAHEAGLHVKQSEVHGMAQRGGAVSAFVRISEKPVSSDLIADGAASMILSVEPMEALRYTKLLKPEGWIVTDVTPMVNIPDYPETSTLYPVLFSVPQLVGIDATRLAQKAGNVKVQNMVVLGAAASHLPLPAELLERQLHRLFESKGERIVKANIHAFRKGDSASRFAAGLKAEGVAQGVIALILPRMHFPPHPVPWEWMQAWARRLLEPDAASIAQAIFDGEQVVGTHDVPGPGSVVAPAREAEGAG